MNIYWSNIEDFNELNWSILYKEPVSVYQDLLKNKSDELNSFFKCPSFIETTKNIFMIRSPLSCSYNFYENKKSIEINNGSLKAEINHNPSIKNNILFEINHSYIFFSEKNVEMTLSSPFFHKCNYMKYGAIVPGKINIEKWFRTVNLEINLWNNIDNFFIEENEPLAYFNFFTQEKINLKRFQITDNLKKISKTISTSSSWEPKVSLKKRYDRFKDSKLKDIILSEINKNII